MSTTDSDLPPLQLGDPLIGARLGEYEVLEAVGEGGMGVVYRGIQPLIKKRVAIKVLKPGAGGDRAMVKALLAEAEAVNAVGHRNIIDIFSFGQLPDGRPYVVMEFLEGMPLDAYLAVVPRPDLDEALSILADVASPLAAAHRAGVVHRDLKPSNVFLCSQGDGTRFVKLLDFGLAHRVVRGEGSAEETQRAFVSGTPDYMAPEQARNEAITPSTDLYALGCMAFEMVTGRRPFTGVTPMDVMMAQTSAPVPRAASLVPELPPELDALLARMMAKAPAQRPRSADEVREVLLRVRASLGGGLAMAPRVEALSHRSMPALPPRPSAPSTDEMAPLPAPPPAPVAAPASAPRRGGLLVAGVLGLGALVAVLVLALRPGAAPPPPAPEAAVAAPVAPTTIPTPTLPPVAPTAAPPPEEEEMAPAPGPRTGAATPRPAVAPAPTAPQLTQRIERLERALTAALQAGADVDPSARQYLQKYRVEAAAAGTPAERTKVGKSLEKWERTFLAR